MGLGMREMVIFNLGVIMGTGSTIISKMIYEMQSVGSAGVEKTFGKPIMTTWIMFLGMSFAMPLHWIETYYKNRNRSLALNSGEIAPLRKLSEPPLPTELTWSTYFSLLVPAAFDLVGTALSGVGLMYTTTSVYQLVRCTVIIVTAVLKATMLKHRIAPYAWFGLLINTLAMILVSCSSFIHATSSETTNSNPTIGITFILLSCVVQGAQYVFEERVMSFNNAPPLVVVGMEGVWGSLMIPFIVLPLAYYMPGPDNGCIEDIFDTLIMMQNNEALKWMLLLFCGIVFFYNVFCIYVTYLLDSIWHAILDNFRPVSVWAVDLLLFYVFTEGGFGESWGPWSWIQLAGMIMLFYGTAVYNASVTLPWFDYTEYEEDLGEEDTVLPPFPRAPGLSSPFIAHSPRIFKNGTPILGPTPMRKRQPGSFSSQGREDYSSFA